MRDSSWSDGVAIVIAIHEIEDVAGFWAAVHDSATDDPPARLNALYPLVNGSKAISVWDGASADVVGDFLDARIGHFGISELYEVDRKRAPYALRRDRRTQEEDRP